MRFCLIEIKKIKTSPSKIFRILLILAIEPKYIFSDLDNVDWSLLISLGDESVTKLDILSTRIGFWLAQKMKF